MMFVVVVVIVIAVALCSLGLAEATVVSETGPSAAVITEALTEWQDAWAGAGGVLRDCSL